MSSCQTNSCNKTPTPCNCILGQVAVYKKCSWTFSKLQYFEVQPLWFACMKKCISWSKCCGGSLRTSYFCLDRRTAQMFGSMVITVPASKTWSGPWHKRSIVLGTRLPEEHCFICVYLLHHLRRISAGYASIGQQNASASDLFEAKSWSIFLFVAIHCICFATNYPCCWSACFDRGIKCSDVWNMLLGSLVTCWRIVKRRFLWKKMNLNSLVELFMVLNPLLWVHNVFTNGKIFFKFYECEASLWILSV